MADQLSVGGQRLAEARCATCHTLRGRDGCTRCRENPHSIPYNAEELSQLIALESSSPLGEVSMNKRALPAKVPKDGASALERARLGREEAESHLKVYKEMFDTAVRQRHVACSRLETVMASRAQAIETHAHTKTQWEKEVRRIRQEAFRSQSMIVKLQEELKSARQSFKASESTLEQEKERSKKREDEAFGSRYRLVGLEEEISKLSEKLRAVEGERDALKAIARQGEIERIAVEGRLPLPPSSYDDDEFASPTKAPASLSLVTITTSATEEEEREDLQRQLDWEKHRAKRAEYLVEFLEVESKLRAD